MSECANGHPVRAGEKFCGHCGVEVNASPPEESNAITLPVAETEPTASKRRLIVGAMVLAAVVATGVLAYLVLNDEEDTGDARLAEAAAHREGAYDTGNTPENRAFYRRLFEESSYFNDKNVEGLLLIAHGACGALIAGDDPEDLLRKSSSMPEKHYRTVIVAGVESFCPEFSEDLDDASAKLSSEEPATTTDAPTTTRPEAATTARPTPREAMGPEEVARGLYQAYLHDDRPAAAQYAQEDAIEELWENGMDPTGFEFNECYPPDNEMGLICEFETEYAVLQFEMFSYAKDHDWWVRMAYWGLKEDG